LSLTRVNSDLFGSDTVSTEQITQIMEDPYYGLNNLNSWAVWDYLNYANTY